MSDKRIIRREIEKLAGEYNEQVTRLDIVENKSECEKVLNIINHKYKMWCRRNPRLRANEKAFLKLVKLCQ